MMMLRTGRRAAFLTTVLAALCGCNGASAPGDWLGPVEVQAGPEDPGSRSPHLAATAIELVMEADALANDIKQQLGMDDRLWFFYETHARRQPVLDILKVRLDEEMILARTMEAHGSFFDTILVYSPRQ